MTKKTPFFEGWSKFKFNNLGLAVGANLTFYTSLWKGLKLKVKKFWGLIPTFVEVTGEKLVWGGGRFGPPPPPSWIGLTWKIQFQSLKSLLFISLFFQTVTPVTLLRQPANLSTRIKEHFEMDKTSHIFPHLVNNETCKALSTKHCFEIINSTSTPFRLKLKEALHII